MNLKEWCEQNNRQDLIDQWSSENEKPINEYTDNSSIKVEWVCPEGHKWNAFIRNRTKLNSGCPYCAGQRAIVGVNDLVTLNPTLASEWNYEKNGNLLPSDFMPQSSHKVWWKCPKGHEWQARIQSRTKVCGCPYCGNKKVLTGYNDLATTNPKLASEWNYEKNGGLKPTDVIGGNNKKVWWKCKEGHEWQACINARNQGTGCPYCSGYKVIKGKTDLQTVNPELAAEWHPTKNESLKPSDILPNIRSKVWWRCSKGHEWKASVVARSRGSGCPVCNKERHVSFPEMALFFYVKKYYTDAINSDTDAIGMELDIYIPSLRIAVEYDGVAWHKNVTAQKRELKKNTLCNDNNIILIRIREKGLDLYDDCFCIQYNHNPSNKNLSDVIKRVLFELNVKNPDVDVNRDSMLIQALYINREKNNSLQTLFPEIASEWHPTKNNHIEPDMVTAYSSKHFWWKCAKGHEWKASISNRVKGRGCPYCGNKKVLAGYNDLSTLKPNIIFEWNYEKNNNLQPSDVLFNSSKKVWWKCSKGHEYKETISNKYKGTKCPYCSDKDALAGYNDLFTTNPELVLEWDYNKNNGLEPTHILPRSSKIVWWKCSFCGYEWQTAISNRALHKSGCPNCADTKRKMTKHHNALRKNGSLQDRYPMIAAEWNYEKNGDLKPSDVTAKCNDKVWWKCSFCGYEWKAVIGSRVASGKCGCANCTRKKMIREKYKPVVCVETGIIYDNIADASRKTGMSKTCICRCCTGKRETTQGYHWKYVEEE